MFFKISNIDMDLNSNLDSVKINHFSKRFYLNNTNVIKIYGDILI